MTVVYRDRISVVHTAYVYRNLRRCSVNRRYVYDAVFFKSSIRTCEQVRRAVYVTRVHVLAVFAAERIVPDPVPVIKVGVSEILDVSVNSFIFNQP